MNSVVFYALGGLDDDGKNLYCIEINGNIFVIDAGVSLPDNLMPGVDYIIPDYNYLKQNKHRVAAYILTHAHEDQAGALPFFYNEIPAPVYLTMYTKLVLEILTKKYGLNVTYDFRIIKSSDDVVIKGVPVHFFSTTHNSPSSFGVVLDTDLGNIVYSGNFIVEYNLERSFKYDLNNLAKYSETKTLLLISESAYAERSGYTSPLNRITSRIETLFKEFEGRIIVSLFTQNAYNLNEIIKLAIQSNRKILYYDKETEEKMALLEQSRDLVVPSQNVRALDDINRLPEDEILVIMVSSDAPLYNEIKSLANGHNDDKRVVIKPTDAFLVIAPPPTSLEKLATEAIDDLYRTGCKVVYITRKELLSMHASQEDLKMLITLLSPEHYIPVQGDYRALYANATLAYNTSRSLATRPNGILLLDNGMKVTFDEKGAHFDEHDRIHVSNLAVDGFLIGESSSKTFLDRQVLSDNGIILVGFVFSKSERRIVSEIEVVTKGYIQTKSISFMKGRIEMLLKEVITSLVAENRFTIENMKELFKEKVSRFTKNETLTTPKLYTLIEEVA